MAYVIATDQGTEKSYFISLDINEMMVNTTRHVNDGAKMLDDPGIAKGYAMALNDIFPASEWRSVYHQTF